MNAANRCLVICRSVKNFPKLARIRPDAHTCYVVASDDPTLQQKARSLAWVQEVSFIEKIESYYPVAGDVIQILEQVNAWLESFTDPARDVTADLLRWMPNVEGGFTVQRIQDALLLIRSYDAVFELHRVSEVVIVPRGCMSFEDRVLRATAIVRGIQVKTYGGFPFLRFWPELLEVTRLAAREAYYLFNIMRVKLWRPRSNRRKPCFGSSAVLFQLCSSSCKHVENIVSVMQALNRKGYPTAAFCWSASERYHRPSGADQVRLAQCEAHALEPLASLKAIWRSRRSSAYVWRRARAQRAYFTRDRRFAYRSVLLGDLLWPSIRFFFKGELPQRIRYSAAVAKYSEDNRPLAVKFWGVNEFFEGLIARKQFALHRRPMSFAYWLGNADDSPYSESAPGRQKHGKEVPCTASPPPVGASASEQMRYKLQTPEGQAVYKMRKAVVEPVFGQIKERRGFRRFLLRGLARVEAEWMLICATHNLLKLFHSGWRVQTT